MTRTDKIHALRRRLIAVTDCTDLGELRTMLRRQQDLTKTRKERGVPAGWTKSYHPDTKAMLPRKGRAVRPLPPI